MKSSNINSRSGIIASDVTRSWISLGKPDILENGGLYLYINTDRCKV